MRATEPMPRHIPGAAPATLTALIIALVSACSTPTASSPASGRGSATSAPPAERSEAPEADSTTALPTDKAAVDENAYLNQTQGNITSKSPTELLQIGYNVCDKLPRGWDYPFLQKDVDVALWGPPSEPRPTSYLIPDFAETRDEALIISAMQNLCGMSLAQIGEWFHAHNGPTR